MPPATALVTGATDGIGRATAFALGRAGYRVGICARRPDGVEATLRDLRKEGITAEGRPADVGRPEDVAALVAQVEASLGPVDTLVNNAGIGVFKPFADTTLEEWDATMATNLRSLYLVTRAVLPGMRARKSGFIVNVASLAGKNAVANAAAYAASKHGVLGFSRSLMLEVRKEGVRVLAICPGSVDTPLLRGQAISGARPGTMLQAEDVAQAIVDALRADPRALVSEIDIRPANP
jgi:short-subunit dehydrogenase